MLRLIGCTVLATLCFCGAFPPLTAAFLGYLWLPILAFGLKNTQSTQARLITTGSFGFFSWLILLFWLRHVTWAGTIVLAAIMGLFLALWSFIAITLLSGTRGQKDEGSQGQGPGRGFWGRVAPKKIKSAALEDPTREQGQALLLWQMAARPLDPRPGPWPWGPVILLLACFWVSLEWLRTVLFTGFPWLPLASIHWQSPFFLQLSAFTGVAGVSFLIISVNLALSTWIWQKKTVFLVLAGACIAILGLFGLICQNNLNEEEPLLRVGIVQPNIKPELKWNPEKYKETFIALHNESLMLKGNSVEMLLWPETAIPTALNEDFQVCSWACEIAKTLNCILLTGALSHHSDNWQNALFCITPQKGLSSHYYAKEQRVPFGEYVPFKRWIPFIDKAVPVDFDLMAGTFSQPLLLATKERHIRVGSLICYEDIFARLARKQALAGVDCFVVITNDAWYGEEAGAYQHAAHSVLRAIETRRPFIRCGNHGWSGWIDEYGKIQAVFKGETESIYARGHLAFDCKRAHKWKNDSSLHTRWGDWFSHLCSAAFLFGIFCLWKRPIAH